MTFMKSIPFDTLAYVNKLMSAGFTREQAEVQAEAIAELIDNNIATKRDIEELRKDLLVETKQLENRMTIKLGTIMALSVGIVAALVKLL